MQALAKHRDEDVCQLFMRASLSESVSFQLLQCAVALWLQCCNVARRLCIARGTSPCCMLCTPSHAPASSQRLHRVGLGRSICIGPNGHNPAQCHAMRYRSAAPVDARRRLHCSACRSAPPPSALEASARMGAEAPAASQCCVHAPQRFKARKDTYQGKARTHQDAHACYGGERRGGMRTGPPRTRGRWLRRAR